VMDIDDRKKSVRMDEQWADAHANTANMLSNSHKLNAKNSNCDVLSNELSEVFARRVRSVSQIDRRSICPPRTM
jgi:hypothetical protein